MVIFHSYVSLPEGIGSGFPRFVFSKALGELQGPRAMHNLSQGVGGGLIDVHLSPVKKRGRSEHPP